MPRYGCINVHASLLPKYRGAAPIQWAVINGDEFTGVTTMRMDEGVDTGDMIAKSTVRLAPDETGGSCLISSQQGSKAVCGDHEDDRGWHCRVYSSKQRGGHTYINDQ